MRRLLLLSVCASLVAGLVCNFFENGATAMENGGNSTGKAILLVAFGTNVPEAARAFEDIEKRVREKYAGTEVRWAYTSHTIRKRLSLDSPEEALSKLAKEGFPHVAVLSLHIVPGREYEDLCRESRRFRDSARGIDKIEIASPLLASEEDRTRVVEVLSGQFRPKKEGEGVIFVGHGNPTHPSDAIYPEMNGLFMKKGPNLFVGTVEGNPSAEMLLPMLKKEKIGKVLLVPLMTTAGNHAHKDMGGDGPESWKTLLAKEGIQSETLFRGLAQDPEIVSIWLDHLKEAFSKL